jgi:5'-3' exoribonuclease 1
MTLSEIASEDPRFVEKEALPLSEEFPEGSGVFFLGERAYGVAAQVSTTTDKTRSVIPAVRLPNSLSHHRFR